MSPAAYFDIALSLPLFWGIYKGFTKGFIIEFSSIIALALGIYGGVKFSEYTSDILQKKFDLSSQYLPVISFALTFVVLVIAVHLLAKLIETVINIASLKLLNKIAGAALGFLKMGIIVLVLLFIINKINSKMNFIPGQLKAESVFYKISGKISLTKEWLEEKTGFTSY